MKKLIFLLIAFTAIAAYAADDLLTTPKPLISLTAEGIRSGFGLSANADNKTVKYAYYWLDASGRRIYPYAGSANGQVGFTCRDWDSVPDIRVSDCVALDDPDDCCEDLEVGTCDDVFDNADCTGDGEPLGCCTNVAEGVCDCWNDIKSLLIPVKNYLDGEVDKWENISRQ